MDVRNSHGDGRKARPAAWAALAAAVLSLSALSGAAWAAERVALVIGNGAYAHAPPLPNPPKDAAGAEGTEPDGSVETRKRWAEEIVLPDGLTLADWALLAEDRLKAGEHARLLEEAGAHLREHGPDESVAAIREQAVSGLIAEVRVTTREDAPGALDRIAQLEAAAGVGERLELLRLKARAHGLLGDHEAEAAAYLQWLRSVPQAHPERRDVLSARARALVAHEQIKQFSELLGRPFSHEWREDSVGWTDLHYAALLDLPGVVAALCDSGMDADIPLKDGFPVFGEDLERTLAALGYKEEFETRTAKVETPLMIAAEGNARDAAAELIACGADVNARALEEDLPVDRKSGTPLSYAARSNSLEMVKLLIERGADVNADFWDGWTPLHSAASNNSLEMAKLLIEHGADMNPRVHEEITAVEFESGTPLSYAARSNSLEMVKLLIEHGADVNSRFWNGSTPLHSAASNNSLEMVKLLIKRGADVNAQTDYYRDLHLAPLNHAARNNSLDMAKLLIEHGADVNSKIHTEDDIIWPPLHDAVNSLEMVKLLIEHGADVNAVGGASAWGGGSTPLQETSNNSLDVARLLIEHGADVNAGFWNGSTPLHSAASNNSLDMAKLLIEHGADVNAKKHDVDTPLHRAASNNSLDVARLLIEHGADVNAKGSDDATPLHSAASNDSLAVAKLLIEHGADVNAKENFGNTPLDISPSLADREGMGALLRRHGGRCAMNC